MNRDTSSLQLPNTLVGYRGLPDNPSVLKNRDVKKRKMYLISLPSILDPHEISSLPKAGQFIVDSTTYSVRISKSVPINTELLAGGSKDYSLHSVVVHSEIDIVAKLEIPATDKIDECIALVEQRTGLKTRFLPFGHQKDKLATDGRYRTTNDDELQQELKRCKADCEPLDAAREDSH